MLLSKATYKWGIIKLNSRVQGGAFDIRTTCVTRVQERKVRHESMADKRETAREGDSENIWQPQQCGWYCFPPCECVCVCVCVIMAKSVPWDTYCNKNYRCVFQNFVRFLLVCQWMAFVNAIGLQKPVYTPKQVFSLKQGRVWKCMRSAQWCKKLAKRKDGATGSRYAAGKHSFEVSRQHHTCLKLGHEI